MYVARKLASYVKSEEEFETAWGEFFVDGMAFAGIDCEYFPVAGAEGENNVKKVALLQLTGPRCTLLYHIARMASKEYREVTTVFGEYLYHHMPSSTANSSQTSSFLKSWSTG